VGSFQWSTADACSVTIDGVHLEARCFGPPPGEAPVIVLLHEGLGCVELWRDFPQALVHATGLGVFAYSRQGYGQSAPVALPRPLDYMSREADDVLPGLLNALQLKHCILLGHSDGASIAALYAGGSAADVRVRGLVLMAPHFFTEEISLAAIRKTTEHYNNGDLKHSLSVFHKHVDCAFRGWSDSWLHPEFKNRDITDCIDYFRIPVLAIQGQQDQYGTLAHIEVIQERCYAPVETVILDHCRHSPHIDQPQATLSAISDYVQRLQEIENTSVSNPAIAR